MDFAVKKKIGSFASFCLFVLPGKPSLSPTSTICPVSPARHLWTGPIQKQISAVVWIGLWVWLSSWHSEKTHQNVTVALSWCCVSNDSSAAFYIAQVPLCALAVSPWFSFLTFLFSCWDHSQKASWESWFYWGPKLTKTGTALYQEFIGLLCVSVCLSL